MKYLRHLHILLFICYIFTAYCAPKDSVKIVFDDQSVFRGVRVGEERDSAYFGSYYSLDFSTAIGYHKYINGVLTPQFCRFTTLESSDTIYINDDSMGGCSQEIYSHDSYIIINPKELHLELSKQYNASKDEWRICNSSYGRKYGGDNDHILFNLDSPEDKFMMGLLFAISFFISIFILLSPILAYLKGNNIPIIISLLAIGLTIYALIFVNKYLQYSIALPFLSLCAVFGLTLKLIKREDIRYTIAGLSALVVTIWWIWYMFYNLDDTARLNDGKEVNIHWRAGTDPQKRFIVKRLFNNMCPVPIEDKGVKYTVYVSKYELSEGEFSILNDVICGWIGWLFHDDVLSNFSYRESQLVLNTISDISGVKLDFLSYYEWQTASCGKHHDIHPEELTDVDDGEENRYGLVNITGNIAEYSNTYLITKKIGLSGDTILPSFETIVVCGNAYLGGQTDISYVNKNLRRGGAGIRPVYRPDNIGRRQFAIYGILRNECNFPGFPKKIVLKSLNGIPISAMSTYEDFEEKLIESRFKAKEIEAVDGANGEIIKLKMPKGLCYYDFLPYFKYTGFDNKMPTLIKIGN